MTGRLTSQNPPVASQWGGRSLGGRADRENRPDPDPGSRTLADDRKAGLLRKCQTCLRSAFLSKRAGFAVKGQVAGCPARIRTSIDGVRVRSLAIRRRGNGRAAQRLLRHQRARLLVSCRTKVKRVLHPACLLLLHPWVSLATGALCGKNRCRVRWKYCDHGGNTPAGQE